jgi:threonine/homoserine/homoserine lactone efflux protein
MAKENKEKPAKEPKAAKVPKKVKADSSKVDDSKNPVWFAPLMVTFFLVGLAWILVFYISAGRWPVQELSNWNILIGFGIIFIGFGMTMRWK